MKEKSTIYPIVFMLVLSAVLVFVLAYINEAATPIIEFNSELELKEKILYVFDIPVNSEEPEEIDRVFNENIETEEYKDTSYYIYKNGSDIEGYAIPFEGPGLWGTITGYVGVDQDFTHTTGVEFIKQDETPGLGGRISEEPYKKQFRGIDISDPIDNQYVINRPATGGNIDAIAGATQTSNFVTDMINADLLEFIESKGGSN